MFDQASHADPSTVPAMVATGAVPALLEHLSTQSFKVKSSGTQAPRHQERADYGALEQSGLTADEPPSQMLSARLLYAFSLVPDVRCAFLLAGAESVGVSCALAREFRA